MRVLRFVGKLLISLGVGVLLFVLWTLYGTGIQTAREQNSLSQEFEKTPEFEVAAPADPSSPYRSPPASFRPESGDAVFRLRIPKIRLNDGKGYIVVEGVDVLDLEKGPGHYPSCRSGFAPPLCTQFPETWPGEKGRVVVSGHRTTHGAPFYHVDQLDRGDKIFVDTKWGDFVYVVTEQQAVLPSDPNIVIEKDDEAELVLTTCNPPYSASQRLITYARMVTT
jgi:sortase A